MEHRNDLPQLGTVQQDTLTGFEGVVVNVAYHATGCERIALRARDPDMADDEVWFYPTQLTQTEGVQTDVFGDDPVTSVPFDLGWKLRDRITGAGGIATTINFSLYNCPRAALTPISDDPPEEPQDRFWFDEPKLEVVDRPDGRGLVSSLNEWIDTLRDANGGETGAPGTDLSRKSDAE